MPLLRPTEHNTTGCLPDWALDLVFSKDIVQLPTLRSATMSEPEGPLTGGPQNHESRTPEHSESRQ
jgi:hypothetical protein